MLLICGMHPGALKELSREFAESSFLPHPQGWRRAEVIPVFEKREKR